MASRTAADEEQFRFIVKIMPPRRPANSLFRRLQQPKVDEPLHTIAVPARASETFADVWKHIRERYHRNYGPDEVAKGWFHKLQDRFGADIDSHDGVGALGYNPRTPKEDLVLVMLQNEIDRDGSVPETTGLRPPGFSRPELSAEQELEVKRRKDQEKRYGAALEEVDEDTPINSRERSVAPGSPQLGEETASARKVDADGFAVPNLPGSITRKRKRTRKSHEDTVQSSMDGENEDDILVPGSQAAPRNIESVPNSFPDEPSTSRARSMRSMPADAVSGASKRDHTASRARTAAPGPHSRRSPAYNPDRPALEKSRLSALETGSKSSERNVRNGTERPRSPPTPVSGVSEPVTQQPPESAQRPKPSQASTSTKKQPQDRTNFGANKAQNDDDYDPIEDDDLLSGIAGTAGDDYDEYEFDPEGAPQTDRANSNPATSATAKPGKLKKPNKLPTSTPKSSGPKLLSGTQGSASRNPRSQSAVKNLWSVEEDSYILKGIRRGLSAAQIVREFGLEGRTTSAVRGRLRILLSKNPDVATQRGVSEVPSEQSSNGPASSKKRQAWPPGDIQIMSRAIANGYDSLEIQGTYFQTRTEDAVNRKVLAIQDVVWKNAAKDAWFPENRAKLEGWTLKDSCKLRRTFRENLPTQEAKHRFFGRWEMSDVQRQLNAYKAQVKEIAARQGRSMEAARYDEDLLNASSQLPVNSSPVERSIQSRAARRSSGDALQHHALELTSSPPQQSVNTLVSKVGNGSSAPARRASSPRVEISSSEQENARGMLSRPPSGSGGQTTLNLTRDKGKKRAGAARPTDEELDAQYNRRPSTASIQQSATQPQRKSIVSIHRLNESPAIDDFEEHTPADDLDMLDAQLDADDQRGTQRKPSHSSAIGTTRPVTTENTILDEPTPRRSSRVSQQSPLNASKKVGMQTPDDAAMIESPSNSRLATGDSEQTGSARRSLLSPMETRGGRTPTSSDERRRSRVESGVDTRAAVQLSQELQRSLSSEEVAEAAQESQAFQTQDNATTRSQRIAAASKAVPLSQEDVLPTGDASQKLNRITSTSPRESRKSAMATSAPEAAQPSQHHIHAMQPSPRVGASDSNITPAATPGTTPARSGRLPARGQSYASRIRDLQRSSKPAPSAASTEQGEPSREVSEAEENKTESRDQRDTTPTDAELWQRTANATELGRNREEYFQDLKISSSSVRAMARGDWNEVQRLKTEERRLRRQRKMVNGDSVISQQDFEHQDGPATGGDVQEADDDVVRADGYSRESSEAVEDDGDEKIWSDADFEQPEEMDRERHFSEVKDDDEVASPDDEAAPDAVDEPPNGEDDPPNEVNNDQEMLDPDEALPEPANDAINQPAAEEEEDDLELPTVATLPETNVDVCHALTDDNLQELNNSGAEDSPARLPLKRKANELGATSSPKKDKPRSDDRAAMPPPQSNKPMSKRNRRRQRAARRHSESGSERSSSVSRHIMSSDGPQQQTPFTPINKPASGHKAKKAKLSETTPNRSPKASQATSTQRAAGASQGAPVGSSQRANAGDGGLSGLSGLLRKAHIPTPPKKKQTPKVEQKSKKFDLREDDDESESSEDSD